MGAEIAKRRRTYRFIAREPKLKVMLPSSIDAA